MYLSLFLDNATGTSKQAYFVSLNLFIYVCIYLFVVYSIRRYFQKLRLHSVNECVIHVRMMNCQVCGRNRS
jgi:hypothetical protein